MGSSARAVCRPRAGPTPGPNQRRPHLPGHSVRAYNDAGCGSRRVPGRARELEGMGDRFLPRAASLPAAAGGVLLGVERGRDPSRAREPSRPGPNGSPAVLEYSPPPWC